MLTLIPKVKHATSLDQVRPISLCNFLHKIISKIMNDRLCPILDKIVSPQQFGFIPGRSIHHCIALAHDLVSDIDKKVYGGNVVIKIDMAKAYDRLSWVFLIRGMKALGFSDAWCDLVYRNISNCWYTLRIRGMSYGYFKSNRGLRQGDPLSPSLFTLAMEIFSRKINKAHCSGGGVMPYWTSRTAMKINHILYADDVLIFSNGNKSSFRSLLGVMDSFCSNSGQMVQPSKCKIFFSKHIKKEKQDYMLALSGYSHGSFPIRYLGAPLFAGRALSSYFDDLIVKIKDRVSSWMKPFLSMAGRITLIRSVLQSIPIHCMSVLPVPKRVLAQINKHLRNFLWDVGVSHRRHWVRWDVICSDTQAGGLGIKSLDHVMTCLHAKLAWNFLQRSSLWAEYAWSRYKIGGRGSCLWKNISPFITSISLDCHWNLGRGDTNTLVFCRSISFPCQGKFKSMKIADVLRNPDLKRSFVHNSNPRIFNSIDSYHDSSFPDCLVWDGDPVGFVTTANFSKFISNPCVPIRRFEMIWQNWLPTKISIFLWRLLHEALPTLDNVMKIGIQLANRCFCCGLPGFETMEHLFLYSDHAKRVFEVICPLFGKQFSHSLHHLLYDWGVDVDFKKYKNCLAFGILAGCLFDIWKARNRFLYDNKAEKVGKGSVFKWAYLISSLINFPCDQDHDMFRILNALHISPRMKESKSILWIPWLPSCHGNTCNVSIVTSEVSSRMAAIIRDGHGVFIAGLKIMSRPKHFLLCMIHLIHELKRRNVEFRAIHIPNEEVFYLGRNSSMDCSLLPSKRWIVRMLSKVEVIKISHSLNRPANALCFSDVSSLFVQNVLDLPKAVFTAIGNDFSLHPCSSHGQRIFI